jgi:hypothetical protein
MNAVYNCGEFSVIIRHNYIRLKSQLCILYKIKLATLHFNPEEALRRGPERAVGRQSAALRKRPEQRLATAEVTRSVPGKVPGSIPNCRPSDFCVSPRSKEPGNWPKELGTVGKWALTRLKPSNYNFRVGHYNSLLIAPLISAQMSERH